MSTTNILNIIRLTSLGLLIVGILISALFIIPLQVKQAKVKNGLAMLRRLMLLQGILNLLVGVAAISAITSAYFTEIEATRYVSMIMVLIFSVSFLTFIVIWVIMYRQQFSTDQKRLHEKVAKQELKENK